MHSSALSAGYVKCHGPLRVKRDIQRTCGTVKTAETDGARRRGLRCGLVAAILPLRIAR